MTDDDSSAYDGRADDGSPGTRDESAGDADDWGEADAGARADAGAGVDADGRVDADAHPAVDEDLRDVVEYDLADLAEKEEAEDYPAMDDPVDPQSIDVENAAFVVLGVLAMVGLIAHLLLGVL